MTQYSAYVMDGDQPVARVTLLECASDEEAGRQAAALVDDRAIELWDGQRRIGRFNPVPDPAANLTAKAPDLLTEATTLHKAGKFEEAGQRYAALLATEPRNPTVLSLLGTLHLHRNNPEEAVRAFELSLDVDPRQATIQTLLGDALSKLKRHPEAVLAYERAIVLRPGHVAAYTGGGDAWSALGRYEHAIASYDKVIALDPNNLRARVHRDFARVDLAYRDALARYANASRLTPSTSQAHNNLGNALAALRRYEAAILSYDKAISLEPREAEFHFNRANALRELGYYEDAVVSYDRATALHPNLAYVYLSNATALSRLGRYEETVASLEKAIVLEPGDPLAHVARGDVLTQLNRLDDALASYELAIALGPEIAEAHYGRGNALGALQRHSEALSSYQKGIQLRPDFPQALQSRSSSLLRLGRLDEAQVDHERATELVNTLVPALCERGQKLLSQERHAEALTVFNRAIALKPESAESYRNCARAQRALWLPEEALASIEYAIDLEPSHAEAYADKGLTLANLQRFKEAAESYDRAIAIDHYNADAHKYGGDLCSVLRRFEAGLIFYDNAIAVRPNYAAAYYARASVLRKLNRYDEALASINKAIEIDPLLPYAQGDRIFIKKGMCLWDGLEDNCNEVRDGIERGLASSRPFPVLTIDGTADIQKKCAELYSLKRHPPTPLLVNRKLGRPHAVAAKRDRIRVAYLSSDFYAHATAFLMAGVFEEHDKSQFEVFAISWAAPDGSEMHERLRNAFEHIVDVREKHDREVAAFLREKKVDIAVDLKGYTQDSRPQIFAFRPAPIQVNYLGFPGTTGANYIDYIIADRIVIPEAQQHCYTEKVAYLPDTYQCNDTKRRMRAHIPGRAEVGLPEDAFVFCSFNNPYKITPEIFDVWMRLLLRTENSVLWLLETNGEAKSNLQREALRRGVAAKRLVFAPGMHQYGHIARYQLADLFLDSLPCCAHTTASDALWAGVPVLTCIGETFAGRVAASLLNAIGLPEMVTHSLGEYEERALGYARYPTALVEIKAKLLRNRETYPLFDTVRFTRHLEEAYVRMIERHRRGQPPEAFAVEALEPRSAETPLSLGGLSQPMHEESQTHPAKDFVDPTIPGLTSVGARSQGIRLNVGCGRNILQGWVNLDWQKLEGVDVVADLNKCRDYPLPFADDSVDELLLSHVIEHVPDPLAVMQELYRIAKPGAKLTARVPYGSSDGAWEDPTHVRAYFLHSWGYFSQPFFWRADYGYTGDWKPETITLRVDRESNEGLTKKALMHRVHTERNIVREMIAELRAVKPARPPERELQVAPEIDITLV